MGAHDAIHVWRHWAVNSVCCQPSSAAVVYIQGVHALTTGTCIYTDHSDFQNKLCVLVES